MYRFLFTTNPEDVQIEQVSCWLTYTNEETHKIIRENLDRSPMYSGVIEEQDQDIVLRLKIRL